MSGVFDARNKNVIVDDIIDGSTGLVALISPERLAILQQLWGMSRGSLDSEASLRIVLKLFAELLNANNCSWLASCYGKSPSELYYIELFNGWWASDIVDYREGANSKESEKIYYKYTKTHGVDPLTQLAVECVGTTRVHSRSELFTDEEWLDHPMRNEFLMPRYNVSERIYIIFNIDEKNESYFVVDREQGGEPFSREDLQLAYIATAGLGALHHRLFFERGYLPPASKPLSPREREVFSLL